jgi:hypothetical protein
MNWIDRLAETIAGMPLAVENNSRSTNTPIAKLDPSSNSAVYACYKRDA